MIRSKTKKKPEAQLQAAIRDWLRAKGCLVIRINSGMVPAVYNGKRRMIRFNDTAGVSDLVACIPKPPLWSSSPAPHALFAAIEVKANNGKTTESQEAFLESIRKAGGIAFVARSIADVERELSWL